MLSESQLEKLLGRSLTTTEKANRTTYIDIAEKRLSNLLCFNFCTDSGARTFEARRGYRTLYLDPFTDVTTVTVDGETTTAFTKKQNDSFQGKWFNIIEFDDRLDTDKVTVDAAWGFGSQLPSDLAALLAAIFGIHEAELTAQVRSKEIEDFKVTYGDTPLLDSIALSNVGTIAKYAQCERAVAHGFTRPVYVY